MFCTVSLLVYSSVALDASVRVGSSYLRVVCVLILAVPLLVPRVASPSVVRQLLLMLQSDTLPSARSQWALPTPWTARFSHLPVGGLRDVVGFSRTHSESSRDSPVFKLCFSLCESQTCLPLRLSVRTQRASCDSTAILRLCACDTAILRCDCELNPATGALVRLHSSVPVLLYSLPSSERHGTVTSPLFCVFLSFISTHPRLPRLRAIWPCDFD